MAVGRGIALPRRQATVTLAGDLGGLRIDLVEIVQNRSDRIIEAVEIETVKRDALVPVHRTIVLAQPAHEVAHLGVAPHPGRKPCKRGPLRRRILEVPHVMIDARGIRPVRLDGNKAKALLDDQIARDPFAHPVEFGSAVGCLAEQHDARRPDPFHQRIEIDGLDRGERFRGVGELSDQHFIARSNRPRRPAHRVHGPRASPAAHPSSPINGTKRTSAISSLRYSLAEILMTRTSSWLR